jgi:hypothetical protein
MILPMKDGGFTKIPREPNKLVYFENKQLEGLEHYIDVGLGSYAVIDNEDIGIEEYS